MRLSRRLVGLLLVAGAMIPGCAEQVQDVDRVQPNYVEKALLEGDWYYRQTFVDVPPQTSLIFTGYDGSLGHEHAIELVDGGPAAGGTLAAIADPRSMGLAAVR